MEEINERWLLCVQNIGRFVFMAKFSETMYVMYENIFSQLFNFVSSLFPQIYDAGDFSILCSVQAPRSERWISADFLSTDRVIAWSDEGKGYMYKLPAKYVFHSVFFNFPFFSIHPTI